jgi:exosortase
MPELSPSVDIALPQRAAWTGIAIRPWLTGSLVTLTFVPWLFLHAKNLWERPHYQFFPLVLAGSVLLAVRAAREVTHAVPGQRRVTFLMLGCCWGLLGLATLLTSPWLGTIAALLMLAAVLHAVGGWGLFRSLLPAWAFLWLLVPPPANWDQRLMTGLRGLSARWSSSVLDVLGIAHVPAGNVIEIARQRLLVEEACSGIHSLLAVITCTLFFTLWFRYGLVRTLLLLAAAVWWVLLANVARVVLLAAVSSSWGIDLSHGWRHEALGLLLFALVLALTLSTDCLLRFFRPLPQPSTDLTDPITPGEVASEEHLPAPTDHGPSPLTSGTVAAGFAVLAVAELLLLLPTLDASPEPPASVRAAHSLGADALPAQLGPWQRQQFETRRGAVFGEFSRTWTYTLGLRKAIVSIDYPFSEWHELTRCYRGQGWEFADELRPVLPQSDGGAAAVEVLFRRRPDRHAYLCFGLFDEQGTCLTPPDHNSGPAPDEGFWNGLAQRARNAAVRARRLAGGAPPSPAGPVCFQVQVFIEGYAPLREAEQEHARKLFEAAREAIRQAMQNELRRARS